MLHAMPGALPHHSQVLGSQLPSNSHQFCVWGLDYPVSQTIDSYLGAFTTGWCRIPESMEHCLEVAVHVHSAWDIHTEYLGQ